MDAQPSHHDCVPAVSSALPVPGGNCSWAACPTRAPNETARPPQGAPTVSPTGCQLWNWKAISLFLHITTSTPGSDGGIICLEAGQGSSAKQSFASHNRGWGGREMLCIKPV